MHYEAANRPDKVPCDEGGLEACPFFSKPGGSPGDISENGCGLAPENAEVVQFYPKWKSLGQAAFELVQLEFSSADRADTFANKLMLMEEDVPLIAQAQQSKQEATKLMKSQQENDQKRGRSKRRQSPDKV